MRFDRAVTALNELSGGHGPGNAGTDLYLHGPRHVKVSEPCEMPDHVQSARGPNVLSDSLQKYVGLLVKKPVL